MFLYESMTFMNITLLKKYICLKSILFKKHNSQYRSFSRTIYFVKRVKPMPEILNWIDATILAGVIIIILNPYDTYTHNMHIMYFKCLLPTLNAFNYHRLSILVTVLIFKHDLWGGNWVINNQYLKYNDYLFIIFIKSQ